MEKENYTADELYELFHAACDSFNSPDPKGREFFENVRGSEALRLAWIDDKRRTKEAMDRGIRFQFKKSYLNFIKVLAEDYSEEN